MSESFSRVVSFFGDKDIIVAKSPGRINLIGEHTDYNGGYVMPAAIDKYAHCGVRFNGTDLLDIFAIDLGEQLTIDIKSLMKTKKEWANYVIGILLQLKNRGVLISGMDIAISSDVPIGAGMSSSSAIECALIAAFDALYNLGLTKLEMIEISKQSNHQFLGLQGGIMDQFASLYGKKDYAMILHCDTMQHTYAEVDTGGYSWLLINTCVSHNLIDSGYNDRVRECKEALEVIKKYHPDITSLSDIKSLSDLDASWFENKIPYNRAKHVIEENGRVVSFAKHFADGDLRVCGELLYSSHIGLSKYYEVSCDELDFLVDLCRNDPDVLGSRMMGGGFGGCTINLVKTDKISSIKAFVTLKYKSEYEIAPKFYRVKISDGATTID